MKKINKTPEKLSNPIKAINDSYKRLIPNPATEVALLAALGIAASYGGKKFIKSTTRDLTKDPRLAYLLGLKPEQLRQGYATTQNNWLTQHGLPIAIGLIPASISFAMNMDPNKPKLGMTQWPYMKKKASMWQTPGYQPQLDFSKTINTLDTTKMFQSNPYLQNNDYVRNLGTSIIQATPSYNNVTTLGNVYDSAINKFDKKLEFQGIGSKVLQGALSGSMASMFTDVVGTVFGVPDPLRSRLANSVGVGKALYQILS